MQDLPHLYVTAAAATAKGSIELTSPGLPALETAGPAEFGGPGDRWSPETLITGSVADCFMLSFRAVARASRIEWDSLRCNVVGELNRVEKQLRFTAFRIEACLDIPEGVREEKAMRALEKAKQHCLITNSLTAETTLTAAVRSAVVEA